MYWWVCGLVGLHLSPLCFELLPLLVGLVWLWLFVVCCFGVWFVLVVMFELLLDLFGCCVLGVAVIECLLCGLFGGFGCCLLVWVIGGGFGC